MSTKPKWYFPLRNGGVEFVRDPSSPHFSDNPIPKLVREIIQNSLDARESGISDPIVVKFADTEVERDLIGASQLYKHFTACLERAKKEKMSSAIQKVYEDARAALRKERIQCLRITDSGTTGLTGSNWDALVTREGDVQKSSIGAGGSYGIGKNAVFNVSDAQTVFYSTRYVNGRKGLVEKMQGKATLMAHEDPASGKDLQHIGFYRAPNGDPLETTKIPDFFRLDEPGTGVFIMGFNPPSSDWVDAVTSAVIENFFHAIHHKQLIVEISSESENVHVTHQTIDQLFEGKSSKPNAYYYYLAIRDEEAVSTQKIDKVGVLDVHIALAESAPRRTAYVNRKGMLITDIREQQTNPMHPKGRNLWPDYAVVVSPSTDKGDAWVRTMENPSHDSVSPGQLSDAREQRRAKGIFLQARQAIREIIDKRADIQRYGDTSNLEELAEYFPELDPDAQGNRPLPAKVVPTPIPQNLFHDIDGDRTDIAVLSDETQEGGSIDLGASGTNGGQQGNGSGAEEGDEPRFQSKRNETNPSSRPRISKNRVIPTGVTEAIIAFDPTGEDLGEIKLTFTRAGGERDREDQIRIVDATVLSPDTQEVTVDEEGVLHLAPDTSERIQLKIVTDKEIQRYALKMRLMK